MKLLDLARKALTSRDARAVIIALLFLSAGLATLWLVNVMTGIRDSVVYVTILIVPTLLYVILSGRLAEFRAPGGWTATFIRTSFSPAQPTSSPIDLNTVIEISKKEKGALDDRLKQLDQAQPIALFLELGGHPYDRADILNHVHNLGRYRNFKLAVFVDRNRDFVAYMPSWALERVLSTDGLGDEFTGVIVQGRVGDLRQYPAVITQALSEGSNNYVALDEMRRRNLEVLVVVNNNRRVVGLLERDQVLARMVLSLSEPPSP